MGRRDRGRGRVHAAWHENLCWRPLGAIIYTCLIKIENNGQTRKGSRQERGREKDQREREEESRPDSELKMQCASCGHSTSCFCCCRISRGRCCCGNTVFQAFVLTVAAQGQRRQLQLSLSPPPPTSCLLKDRSESCNKVTLYRVAEQLNFFLKFFKILNRFTGSTYIGLAFLLLFGKFILSIFSAICNYF